MAGLNSRPEQIRAAAALVPGARGVEKCFARKTGLRYHVDLHLEVDPDMDSIRDTPRFVEMLAAAKQRMGMAEAG